MRRFALIGSFSYVSFVVTCVASIGCNDAGPPPATATTVATTTPPVTTVVVDAGAAAAPPAPAPAPLPPVAAAASDTPPAATPTTADGGTDFFACNADTDCVAVAKAACCPTGHKEAVNKQAVGAYRGSVACGTKHRFCPMYRILDKRVPFCNTTGHKCEMSPADKIACSGSGPDVHTCPAGTTCDSGGHCAVLAATAAPATP